MWNNLTVIKSVRVQQYYKYHTATDRGALEEFLMTRNAHEINLSRKTGFRKLYNRITFSNCTDICRENSREMHQDFNRGVSEGRGSYAWFLFIFLYVFWCHKFFYVLGKQ